MNYFTAWQLVVVMGSLTRDEPCVQQAGGGVGIAATQISKHLGGRVIGTSSAPSTRNYALSEVDDLVDLPDGRFRSPGTLDHPAAAASISFEGAEPRRWDAAL